MRATNRIFLQDFKIMQKLSMETWSLCQVYSKIQKKRKKEIYIYLNIIFMPQSLSY